MCEGASKLSPDPKNSTAPGPRPLVLKFLDPPLCWIQCRVKQYLRCLYTEVQGEKHIKTEYIGYRKKKRSQNICFTQFILTTFVYEPYFGHKTWLMCEH